MRKLKVAVMICAVFMIVGCDKLALLEEEPTISGTWELRQTSSQMGLINYPAGNGDRYEFVNNSFKRFQSGAIVDSGLYIIVPDNSAEESVGLILPDDEFNHRIIFNGNDSTLKVFVELNTQKLQLISGYFPLDGGVLEKYQLTEIIP